MKKYIKSILRLVLSLGLILTIGCEAVFEEALDRADDSRETLDGVLGDFDKVRGMLSAAYMGIPEDRTDLYFWTTEELLTDNAFDTQGQSLGNWRSGLLSPSFAAVWASKSNGNPYIEPNNGSWWGRYWGAVRHCNTLISNMENVTVPLDVFPQAERDLFVDEAKVLRAYFHFMLISKYGPLPFMDENLPLDFNGWGEMTRPTYDEIANRIADELQEVIDAGRIPMKRDFGNSNDKLRIPLGFAYGLKSRVLLYNASPLNNPSGDQAKYQAAAAAAKQFLDLNAYSLEPFEDSKQIYHAPLSEPIEEREVIWRGRGRVVQFNNVHGLNLASAVPKQSNYQAFKAGECPTQEIVDCYEMKNGAMIVENYDASHANPTISQHAIDAGYDDVNDPYSNRDDRFYRDILFNGNEFGETFNMGNVDHVWTYLGAPGTGSNGNVTSGDRKATFTGYYYKKDRNPLWYGSGTAGQGHQRNHSHSILMRYAEIYLNYAEALCGAGNFSEAAAALDMTRLRANQPSITTVPDFQAGDNAWLMKRIQNERRVELVLEDHRFYDVRRWDLISDQNNNTVSGVEIEKTGPDSYVHTRYQIPFVWACHNEKYKVLPIPIADQKLMPNMLQPEAWR